MTKLDDELEKALNAGPVWTMRESVLGNAQLIYRWRCAGWTWRLVAAELESQTGKVIRPGTVKQYFHEAVATGLLAMVEYNPNVDVALLPLDGTGKFTKAAAVRWLLPSIRVRRSAGMTWKGIALEMGGLGVEIGTCRLRKLYSRFNDKVTACQ